MAAYCLQANIEKTIGIGLGSAPTPVIYEVYLALSADQITRCIAAADAEIDMYLAAVATVPFTTVPTAVGEVSILLAAARALEQGRLDYSVRSDGPDAEGLGKIPRSNALRAEGQRKLQLIKENAASLLGSSSLGGASGGTPLYNEPTMKFTDDVMDDWV